MVFLSQEFFCISLTYYEAPYPDVSGEASHVHHYCIQLESFPKDIHAPYDQCETDERIAQSKSIPEMLVKIWHNLVNHITYPDGYAADQDDD